MEEAKPVDTMKNEQVTSILKRKRDDQKDFIKGNQTASKFGVTTNSLNSAAMRK
jgi:hypothetical protein